MHIEKLRIQNFRGFKDVTIDFPSNLAVFIGVNGSGKSSIIDCLDNLLFELIKPLIPLLRNSKSIDRTYGVGNFKGTDISNNHQATTNELILSFADFKKEFASNIRLLHCFSFTTNISEPKIDTTRSELNDVNNFDNFIRNEINNNLKKGIPLLVCYSIKRSFGGNYLNGNDWLIATLSTMNVYLSQIYCYVDATNQKDINFESFFLWFKHKEDMEQEIKLDGDLNYQDYQLNLVRKAITSILPDYTDLKVKRSRMQIVLKKQDHELVLNQLSDGEKNLLVMVADIARRLAIANPDPTKNALEGEGSILID